MQFRSVLWLGNLQLASGNVIYSAAARTEGETCVPRELRSIIQLLRSLASCDSDKLRCPRLARPRSHPALDALGAAEYCSLSRSGREGCCNISQCALVAFSLACAAGVASMQCPKALGILPGSYSEISLKALYASLATPLNLGIEIMQKLPCEAHDFKALICALESQIETSAP